MSTIEERILEAIIDCSVDFISYLPCEKIKTLLDKVYITSRNRKIILVPLTREEEAVGLSAGAALSGKKPVAFLQSSGFGNMLNALMSLTITYRLPLALFISHRGIYKEKIKAQIPLGQKLESLLKTLEIPYTRIQTPEDISAINKILKQIYSTEQIHVFLLSPSLWVDENNKVKYLIAKEGPIHGLTEFNMPQPPKPRIRRYELLMAIKEHLSDKAVVVNLGIPAKELFHLKHQPSNFYMLGSMGMATPIGLAVSLCTDKDVIVIDGDGSLLMNPGSLGTVGYFNPPNLTILAVDNGSYGSTGDQPTLTSTNVDLSVLARGFGIREIYKISEPQKAIEILLKPSQGARFIHFLAKPGSEKVENIPLEPEDIKSNFQSWLKG